MLTKITHVCREHGDYAWPSTDCLVSSLWHVHMRVPLPLVGNLPTIILWAHCIFLLSYIAWLVVCWPKMFLICYFVIIFQVASLSKDGRSAHGNICLTIFLSKQQMALLLSFWSRAKIPKAEVLVYTDSAWQRVVGGLASPPVALIIYIFSATLSFSSLLLRGILILHSRTCSITVLITSWSLGYLPLSSVGSSAGVAKEVTELSVWVTSWFELNSVFSLD